jgi:hypothetical protein
VGCGGRNGVRCAKARWTKALVADGEVVWFRRPGAGVKLAETTPLATVTNKPVTEEITKETVKTIACGNAG